MTKRKWNIVCIGVLTLGVMATSFAAARPGHFGRGGGHGLFPFRVLRTLDLTDPQQANIDVIKAAHADRLEGLKNDLRDARKGIVNKLLAEGNIAAEDFTLQQDDLSQIHAALFDEFLAMGLEIRAELSPEQLAAAAAAIERRRELHAEMRAMDAQGQ